MNDRGVSTKGAVFVFGSDLPNDDGGRIGATLFSDAWTRKTGDAGKMIYSCEIVDIP